MLLKYHTGKEAEVELSTIIVLLATAILPFYMLGLIGVNIIIVIILGTIVSSILTAIVFYMLVVFWMAPNNVNFTIIIENTGKYFYRGGDLAGAMIARKGYVLDENLKVVKIDPQNPNLNIIKETRLQIFFREKFGVRYIGLWPLYRIPWYDFVWTSLGADNIEKPRKEEIDYILLIRDIYIGKLEKSEDSKNMPIDWKFSLELEVEDMLKARTGILNWLESVLTKVKDYIRNEVRKRPFDDLISLTACDPKDPNAKNCLQSLGEIMKKDWEASDFLKKISDNYGVKTHDFNILNIDPDEKYRELTTRTLNAEKDRDVNILAAEGVSAATSEQIAGAAMKMIAKTVCFSGAEDDLAKTVMELKKMKSENPVDFKEKFGQEYENNVQILVNIMGMKLGKYFKYDTNASGELGSVTSAIVSANIISQQQLKGGSPPSSDSSDGKRHFSRRKKT